MNPTLRFFVSLLLVLSSVVCLPAQTPTTDTGSVRGRILNRDTGEYVYQARVRVKSPAASLPLETLTDAQGSYQINRVPAGSAIVEVFYTGLATSTETTTVTSGQEARLDFELSASATRPADEAITLDTFVVTSTRETNATALAVNSQRFADNIKSVISVDELGFIGDGSVAGAMKFLPGIDLEPDSSGFSNAITLSGAPSANVPVTTGGFDVMTSADLIQNASGNQNQRSANLMQLSLTNLSRIEINRSPTPDSPGSALAGSVNFVPKSAFERARPTYSLQLFGSANEDSITLSRIAGPQSDRERPIYPGLNFSAVVPVSKDFGFSVTVSHNETPKSFTRTQREKTANWNLATNTFKDTPNNPDHYNLYWYEENNILSTYTRDSLNLTADYRVSANGTLSASFTQSDNQLLGGQRQVRWSIDRLATTLDIVNSTLTTSRSLPTPANNSTILNNTYYTDFVDKNRQLQLKYRHHGRIWSGEIGASLGDASRESHDINRGFIFSSLYNLGGTRIELADIQPWTVGRITATRNNVAVSPVDLTTFIAAGNFTSSVTGTSPTQTITSSLPPIRFKPYQTSDEKLQVAGHLKREFDFSFPLSAKVGFDFSDYKRDQRYDQFLGTNGSGFAYNGTDVSLTQFLNTGYDTPLPAGLGVPSSMDNRKLAAFYEANKARFVQLNPGNDYQTATTNSKFLHETIAAGYLRFDSRHLNNRLWLVYGIRYEHTTDKGLGPRNDPTGNYRRNAAGQFVNAAGNPVPVGTTPALININNSLAAIQSIWFPRGAAAKRTYDSWFPSANATYTLTENLLARASYSTTIGRPDIYNVAPGINLPDIQSTSPRITVTNPGIKPWTSQNFAASLEYYSKNLGDITLRAYRRFVSDAFASQILPAAQAQEIIDAYGINVADYPGNTTVQTLQTVPGEVVTSGLELSTRYSLDELLPGWARGFQIKASASRATLTGGGEAAAAFAAQNLYLVPYSVGLGVTFSRSKFSLSLNGKWNSQQRLSFINPASDTTGAIEPGTYEYLDDALRLDLDLSYQLTKRFSVFINGRDINGYERVTLRYGPNTPDLLKGRIRDVYQPVWTAGVTAKF